MQAGVARSSQTLQVGQSSGRVLELLDILLKRCRVEWYRPKPAFVAACRESQGASARGRDPAVV